jgi:hypothetical protein
MVDKPYKFSEPVVPVTFNEPFTQDVGWLPMMEAYRPGVCAAENTRVTLGLDTIITGPLDHIVSYNAEPFAACGIPPGDKYTPGKQSEAQAYPINNPVTLATGKGAAVLWQDWQNQRTSEFEEWSRNNKGVKSEMKVLQRLRDGSRQCPRLNQIFFPGILSFRRELRHRRHGIRNVSIVYFHGAFTPVGGTRNSSRLGRQLARHWR